MARILVVDDNPVMRSVMRLALSRGGHEVSTAEDGAQALVEVGAREPFDLIITDVEMPRLDGFGLLHALRKESCPPPVLLMSGRLGLGDLERLAFDEGVSVEGALEKPFTGERLLSKVTQILAGQRSLDAPQPQAALPPPALAAHRLPEAALPSA